MTMTMTNICNRNCNSVNVPTRTKRSNFLLNFFGRKSYYVRCWAFNCRPAPSLGHATMILVIISCYFRILWGIEQPICGIWPKRKASTGKRNGFYFVVQWSIFHSIPIEMLSVKMNCSFYPWQAPGTSSLLTLLPPEQCLRLEHQTFAIHLKQLSSWFLCLPHGQHQAQFACKQIPKPKYGFGLLLFLSFQLDNILRIEPRKGLNK